MLYKKQITYQVALTFLSYSEHGLLIKIQIVKIRSQEIKNQIVEV